MTGVGSATAGSFPKEQRLRKRREYLRVQETGRKIHLHDLLIVVRGNGLDRSRVGVTVSAKVGGAVTRNRLKRILREIWRIHRELFPPGHDIVLVAKRSAAHCRHAHLLQQLQTLRRRFAV